MQKQFYQVLLVRIIARGQKSLYLFLGKAYKISHNISDILYNLVNKMSYMLYKISHILYKISYIIRISYLKY